MKIQKKLLYALGAVAVIAVVYYLSKKGSKGDSSILATGGSVSTPTPPSTPPATPPATPPTPPSVPPTTPIV